MTSTFGPRFKARIEIRAPEPLPAAIVRAAGRELTTPSEYTRRAIIEKLQADGINPLEAGHKP